MREETPYNPLDKVHLGESVAHAILNRSVEPLPPSESFEGAGIYAIYYEGDFPPYRRIAERNRNNEYSCPIYVGQAIPAGTRRGGGGLDRAPEKALYRRLVDHSKSIEAAENLDIQDFKCRVLVVDDIWIPLGEALLIQLFAPLWNTTLDGFGNHDPGKGRYRQQRSPWDMVHPGRKWAIRCPENSQARSEWLAKVKLALESTT